MREIKYIVFHCTATSQQTNIASIKNYWRNVLKWKNNGYHILIDAGGNAHQLTFLNEIANGVAGYNKHSIHVAYIGGVDKQGKAMDNRTMAQKAMMLQVYKRLKKQYPDAVAKGHRDFPGVKKDCPSFDVKLWLKQFGLNN
jgi:N-acetylmuramoyl-L-alanine amidase